MFEMSSERSGTWMGAQVLAQGVPASVLSVISALGPDPGADRDCVVVLGRSIFRDGTGRQAWWTSVQHRRAGRFRVHGWMGVPHVYVARARRYATSRHTFPQRRADTH